MRDDLPPVRDLSAWLRARARTWRPRLRFAGAWRDDPDAWRKELRGELSRLLRLPSIQAADPRIAWQAPTRPHSLTLLEAVDPHGLIGRAWLAAPAPLERGAPAALVVPDGRGAEVVVGQAGREGDPSYDLAAELAAMGLVALVIEPAARAAEACEGLLAMGSPLLGLRAAAGLAWLKYLRGRPDVDARHVGLLGLGEGSRTAALVACLDGCAALALLGGCEAWLAALRADEGPLDGWSLPGLLEVSDWPDLVIAAWTAGLYVETDDAELARLLAEARDVLGHSEAARVAEPGAEGLKTFLDEWLVIPSRAS